MVAAWFELAAFAKQKYRVFGVAPRSEKVFTFFRKQAEVAASNHLALSTTCITIMLN